MKLKFNLKFITMKTLQTTTVLFLLALLFSTTSYSQVVVTNKLDNPESNVIYNSNRSQVWIGGEWVVSEDKYVWKEGSWEDKKPGFIFMPGYWKEVNGGWTWVSGTWKEIDMKQWNNIYA
mgnify:FL=1